MTYFNYTKTFSVDSAVVDDVYYNANERYVVLDLNDNLYRYEDVSEPAVAALVNADSVGAYFNTKFKHEFGPGEYLGYYDEVDARRVLAQSGTGVTAKDLTDATDVPTKEFSLQDFAAHHGLTVNNGGNTGDAATREFSLAEIKPAETKVDGAVNVTSTVFFTLDDTGSGKVFEFESDKESVDDAILEVNNYVSRLGVRGKVVQVVFEFE